MENTRQIWLCQRLNADENDGVMIQSPLSIKQTADILLGIQEYLRITWKMPELLVKPLDLVKIANTLKLHNGRLKLVVTQYQLSDSYVNDWKNLIDDQHGFKRIRVEGQWTYLLEIFEFEVTRKLDRQVFVNLFKSLMTIDTDKEIDQLHDRIENGVS